MIAMYRLLALSGLLLLVVSYGAYAAEPTPAFAANVQGDWHVLLAQRHHKNLAETDPTIHGSKVVITANRLEWGVKKDGKPWLVADCKLAPPPAEAEAKKNPPDPNELVSTTSGSESPNDGVLRFARWKLTDYGVLFFCINIADQVWPTPNHRNGYHGWGSGTMLLVLSREPVPAPSKPDPTADMKRLLGRWKVLTELDDSMANRTRPGGFVEFTAEAVAKRNGQGMIGMSGPYKLLPAAGERGRMDITFTEQSFSLGRCPSLYTFFGDDLLMVVYPESGWKKDLPEEQRQPPKAFQSTGDWNMWILKRSLDADLKAPPKKVGDK